MLERLAGEGGGAPLQMLTGGPRDLPERHQTLRNAIAWSYDLLDEGEKLLYTRLGVFVGGSTLTAAEAVCNAEDDLPMSALDGMESLLAKSLLRYDETGYNEPRFSMLETIREYSLERLVQSGELEATREYHAEYYLALIKAAEPEFTGKTQGLWIKKVDEEHDNLRAVLKWSLAADNGETALRMGAVLWRYWEARCHFSEGRYWLESALKLAETIPTPGRAKSLYGASRLAWLQGDAANALIFAEQSVEMWRELNNKDGLAISMHNLAIVTGELGDHDKALAYYEESLASWEELGDRAGVARVYNSMGELACAQGDYGRAAELYKQSLEIHRSLGRYASVALVTANIGFMEQEMGEYAKAEAHFIDSLRTYSELGVKIGIIVSLVGVGAAAQGLGKVERAATLFGATEALCEATSYALEPRERAIYLASQDAVCAALGEDEYHDYMLDGKAMGMQRAVDYGLAQGD
jgi:tetratricopeptide (TPR) repeat protein